MPAMQSDSTRNFQQVSVLSPNVSKDKKSVNIDFGEGADVSSTCDVNILDITYLINYLYKDGASGRAGNFQN